MFIEVSSMSLSSSARKGSGWRGSSPWGGMGLGLRLRVRPRLRIGARARVGVRVRVESVRVRVQSWGEAPDRA